MISMIIMNIIKAKTIPAFVLMQNLHDSKLSLQLAFISCDSNGTKY